ncbi:taste receptor type 2 member 40 [Clarias gariepinus]|uniref:taste receptor type 2 member 40 n=1 Tax=Clarias gariepinus TaxID=13013 RepID=UPI00234CD6C9|nr:taste receptor type 2 member 40 [Clarias gariepinus]
MYLSAPLSSTGTLMEQSVFPLFLLRIILSVIGILGNGFLIISVLHLTRVKTFEVFLLGLAIANLGEIMLVDIYDAIIQSMHNLNISCIVLKLLKICGENVSIFFTVLICIYRYQKIHNAAMRIIAPIFMDSRDAAIGLSVGCVLIALLFSLPTYFLTHDTLPMKNSTRELCPADFFLCSEDNCPTLNNIYRYLYIIICHVLPLIIVTWTSLLIIKILFIQQKAVDAHHESDATVAHNHHHHHHHHHEHDVFHRSTIGILAAMTLFQVDCILYLILHLVFSPYDFPAWSQLEFFIATLYTGIIPYIYGMGHNFFSVKHFMKE